MINNKLGKWSSLLIYCFINARDSFHHVTLAGVISRDYAAQSIAAKLHDVKLFLGSSWGRFPLGKLAPPSFATELFNLIKLFMNLRNMIQQSALLPWIWVMSLLYSINKDVSFWQLKTYSNKVGHFICVSLLYFVSHIKMTHHHGSIMSLCLRKEVGISVADIIS